MFDAGLRQGAGLISWRRTVSRSLDPPRSANLIYGGAQLIDWRAQRPGGGLAQAKAGRSRLIVGGSLIIDWRAWQAYGSIPSISPVLLHCEADGVGTAIAELVGPPVQLDCEADGKSTAAVTLFVPDLLYCEANGIGSATIWLGGGYAAVTCIATGAVSGSPPTPGSSVLYDAPAVF
jgi:hypothetical protein